MTRLTLVICIIISLPAFAGHDLEHEKPKAKTGLLPVFDKGDHVGKHAVYVHKNFVASVDGGGVLSVVLLEGGNAVSPPIVVGRPSGMYYHAVKRRLAFRNIASFDTQAKPLLQPSRVTLTGRLDDGVAFGVEYRFQGPMITVSGGYMDPQGTRYPTQFRLVTEIPPLIEESRYEMMNEKMTQMSKTQKKRQARALEKLTLETEEYVEGRKRDFHYDYSQKVYLTRPLHEARIKGPWGYRDLLFKQIDKSERFRAKMNSGWDLAMGYTFYYYAADNKLQGSTAGYSVTVK
jgi:hypothetical protein